MLGKAKPPHSPQAHVKAAHRSRMSSVLPCPLEHCFHSTSPHARRWLAILLPRPHMTLWADGSTLWLLGRDQTFILGQWEQGEHLVRMGPQSCHARLPQGVAR